MIMVHSDNKGLVLPPRVAPIQVVIVPIPKKGVEREVMNAYCTRVAKVLKAAGIRTKADLRDNYNPGWKYNHWELKGIPIRIEVGANEVDGEKVMMVQRMDGAKEE